MLYAEIVEGYSYIEELDSYARHFNELRFVRLYRLRDKYLREQVPEAVLSEKDRLIQLNKEERWTEKQEDDLISLKWLIEDNKKSAETIVSSEQKKLILKIVEEKKEEHDELELEKMTLMHPTREFYSRKYFSELLPQFSLFKDDGLTDPKYTEEEYEEFSEEEVAEISIFFSEGLRKFDERTMRVMATLPFVLNQLSLCKKNPLVFLNKPIVQFSTYQQDIYSRTMRNLTILENAENKPIEIDETTEEQQLLDWYDINYAVWQGKNDSTKKSEITKSTKYVHR